MTDLVLIIVSLGLIALNGFFVAAEFALVKLRHTRLEAIKSVYGLRGSVLAKVHSQLDASLSACQLGITLASLGLGWIGEPALARLLQPLFYYVGLTSPKTITIISFFIAFFIITFAHIVIGELAPKSLAISNPQRISLWTALPLFYFYWLMYPFIRLLSASSNLLLKPLGSSPMKEESSHYSSQELKLILSASHMHGELSKEEAEIVDNVLDFTDLQVADFMRPAEELVTLSFGDTAEHLLAQMKQHRFSRYPVYETDPGQIIGILHVKDIFFASSHQSLQQLIRPVLSTEPELPALALFRHFRRGSTQFAIVKQKTGQAIGFVTLDNILQVLLGQIHDEFHKTTPDWSTTPEGALLMKGSTPLYVIEKALNIALPESSAHTIAGLLLLKLERLPKVNERVSFNEFDVMVIKVKGPRILLVKLFPKR